MKQPRRLARRDSTRTPGAHSRSKFEALLDHLPVGLLTLDSTGIILEANLPAVRLLGKQRRQLQRHCLSVFIFESDRELLERHLDQCRSSGGSVTTLLRLEAPGTPTVELSSTAIRPSQSEEVRFRTVIHDSPRNGSQSPVRESDKEIDRLNRTLRALSKSNQTMLRASDEATYISEVCSIVQKDCGHAMVWIGLARDDENKSIVPVAYAGFEEGYLETLRLTWADTERGRGPTGIAIRTGQPSICRDVRTDPRLAPWREDALRRGYAASIALPFMSEGKPFGAITIYSREVDPFGDDEVKLLSELANDLSHGLTYLRLRAAHGLAEESLREGERRYRALFDNMTEGFALHEIITDSHGSPCDYRFLDINPAFEQLTGLKRSELLGKRVLEALPHVERVWIERYGKVALTGEPAHFEEYAATLDRWYEVFAYRPAPLQFAAIFTDVTQRKQQEQARREIEEGVRRKLESVLMPEGNPGVLELADLIDVPVLQKLMNDFYTVARFPMSILDLNGRVLVGVGWQDVCTRFHRVHPETCKLCVESDTQLSAGVVQGEFRLYKCKNNLWDIATPIIVGGRHVGNIFSGQFFFDDEEVDREGFRAQARQYGFEEEAYLAALDNVPRFSRATVESGMAFLLKLAEMLSQLGYSNVTLARLLAERDRLTASLHEEQESLNRAQEIAHLGSWELDLATHKLTWSDEVYRIFGLPPRQVSPTYEDFLGFVHPDDRQAVDAAYAASLRDKRDSYDIEHRVVRTSTGEVRYVHERCHHIRDASGNVIRSTGMVHDITDRRQAEKLLRELNAQLEQRVQERTAELKKSTEALDTERQRFMDVLDLLPAYVILLSPDYHVPFANRYFEERFGKSLGRRCYEYLFNREQPCEVCESFKTLERNAALKWEWTGPDSRIYDISDFPFTDTDGSKMILEMGIDITDRKQAEAELEKHRHHLEDLVKERTSQLSAANERLQNEIAERNEAEQALQQSEERFRLAIRHSQLMAWQCDTEMRFSWVYNSHFGIPDDDLIGKTPAELGNEEGLAEFMDHGRMVLGEQAGARKTVKLTRIDGREQYFDQQIEAIRDADGHIVGLIGISLDVTDRVQAEQRLHKSEESFRLMIAHSVEPMLLVGDTGWIECISRKGAQQLGYQETDLAGMNVDRLLDWSGKLDLTMRLEDFLRHAPLPARGVLRVKTNSGLWAWVDVQASFVNYGQKPGKYLLKFELINTETGK